MVSVLRDVNVNTLTLHGGPFQVVIKIHRKVAGYVTTACTFLLILDERGHKIQFCLKLSPEERLRLQEQQRMLNVNTSGVTLPHQGASAGSRFVSERLKFGGLMSTSQVAPSGPRQGPQKPLDEVTCFKCGEKGHYANRCNKGYLAFLSKVSLQPHEMESARG
ncbi:Cleavage and polyadenylation specificity factor subunit 4 [Schistosoma japonicum]|uniref:Cleavage and polyadenylation specificity factor subunit 4 n=1 Tax=Schistosoma japonicum TaxID=6182 RepID=A0A4Z2CYU7_SCHJA|nr:Cleavage and polyadenylation specificity factor subunit 4 [Schistosoma japonicum]